MSSRTPSLTGNNVYRLFGGRLVTCASDCEQLQRENIILERHLDDEQQRIAECERQEQEAVHRVRDTLQLVEEAQIDKEEVSSALNHKPFSNAFLPARRGRKMFFVFFGSKAKNLERLIFLFFLWFLYIIFFV